MFSGTKLRVGGAVALTALLAWACLVRRTHPQLLWSAAMLPPAWVAMELCVRRMDRQREELAAQLTERTAQLHEEKQAVARATRELQQQAMHDSLTGLWNRAAILGQMEREVVRAQREQTMLAVVIADLDRLKQINDARGNAYGDGVLREAGQRLAFCLREYDSIGRYAGEEFLILMPGYDPAESRGRLDELVGSVRRSHCSDASRQMEVSCSFGATVFRTGGRLASIEELLATADGALYRAKAAGRNCAIFAEMDEMPRMMGRA